jgi:hypothetical protein
MNDQALSRMRQGHTLVLAWNCCVFSAPSASSAVFLISAGNQPQRTLGTLRTA